MLIYSRKHLLLTRFITPRRIFTACQRNRRLHPITSIRIFTRHMYGLWIRFGKGKNAAECMERELKRERDKGESWKIRKEKWMKGYTGIEINKQKSSTKFCCREQFLRTEKAEDVKTSVTCPTQPHLQPTGVWGGGRGSGYKCVLVGQTYQLL